ncbi:type 3 dihydrofolate reductase [Candidatus Thiothrix phosphatis]|nr:type 3 dihydrofolate reductase [Candidatus Thiothrix sp. Deng01]
MLSLIAAMAHQRVIGQEGKMPWHMPIDLAWFKRNTLGKPIIMGRKTWDSIGCALPGRRTLVLSGTADFRPIGAERVASPEAALAAVSGAPEIMIAGGAQVYQYFLPQADRLYLTLIDVALTGDTFFPDYNQGQWRESERIEHPADAQNPYPCTFLILERES